LLKKEAEEYWLNLIENGFDKKDEFKMQVFIL